MVKVGEGWVDFEPVLLRSCGIAKWANILLDTGYQGYLVKRTFGAKKSADVYDAIVRWSMEEGQSIEYYFKGKAQYS